LWRSRLGRFLACWWVLPFVAFCAISGKQIHYLLPLLPAWALAGAWLLQQSGARLKPILLTVLALLAAAGIVLLPWLAAWQFGVPVRPAIACLALVAAVVALGVWRRWGRDVRGLALSATALLSATVLAGALAYWPAVDVGPEAAFVRQTLQARTPFATVDSSNGLFGYSARLRQPVPWIVGTAVQAWCRAHPNGILLTTARRAEPPSAVPFKTWPYALSDDRRIAAWRAEQILAASH
jgi:hypothetical protein